jgi:hypothetical protein
LCYRQAEELENKILEYREKEKSINVLKWH